MEAAQKWKFRINLLWRPASNNFGHNQDGVILGHEIVSHHLQEEIEIELKIELEIELELKLELKLEIKLEISVGMNLVRSSRFGLFEQVQGSVIRANPEVRGLVLRFGEPFQTF